MKNRVSGIMRVKNDGPFIERCIESCIDALDELIVVHNDCTDNSVVEIDKMVARYPDKIKRYEYPHHIYGMNITKEVFEMVRSLPEDSPNLFSTYSNFALSKVTSEYALIIDADQIYFTEQLRKWCDFARECKPQKMTLKIMIGKIFSKYISGYRFLSAKRGKIVPLLPAWLLKIFYSAYINYAKYLFSHDKATLAMSGVNVLEADETLISIGHSLDEFKSLPSFNGCGDHVIFKMSCNPHFEKLIMPEYNPPYTKMYSVVEAFRLPLKIMYVGYFWKHISVMRPSLVDKALALYHIDNGAYLTIGNFKKLSYSKIVEQSSGCIFPLFQQILFAFVYKANKRPLFESLEKLSLRERIKDK